MKKLGLLKFESCLQLPGKGQMKGLWAYYGLQDG